MWKLFECGEHPLKRRVSRQKCRNHKIRWAAGSVISARLLICDASIDRAPECVVRVVDSVEFLGPQRVEPVQITVVDVRRQICARLSNQLAMRYGVREVITRRP